VPDRLEPGHVASGLGDNDVDDQDGHADNIDDDEIIVETAYLPDPALWEPDFKTRRTSR